MTTRWIVIPRWEEFQHRDAARSTVPTWIKAYTKLLSDEAYLELSHHLRGVLLGLWLEYARSTRQLSDSTVSLSRRLGQRVTTRDLESLNHAGFLSFSASKPASGDAGIPAGVEKKREERPSLLQAEEPTRARDQRTCGTCGTTFTRPEELTAHQDLWHSPPTDDDEPDWLEPNISETTPPPGGGPTIANDKTAT